MTSDTTGFQTILAAGMMRLLSRAGKFSIPALVMFLGGCSIYQAAHQPDERDLSLLQPGVERALVVTEFGSPVESKPSEEGSVDLFAFKQGYSKTNKTARAVGHGAMDIATFGMWEFVGTPVEGAFNGEDFKVEVHYDRNQKVERVRYLGPNQPQ